MMQNETTETLERTTDDLHAAALAGTALTGDEPQCALVIQLWASGTVGSVDRRRAIGILRRLFTRHERLLEAVDEDFGERDWASTPWGDAPQVTPDILLNAAESVFDTHWRSMQRRRAKASDTWSRLNEEQRRLMTRLGMDPDEAGLIFDFVVDSVGGIDALVQYYVGRSREEVDSRIRQLEQTTDVEAPSGGPETTPG